MLDSTGDCCIHSYVQVTDVDIKIDKTTNRNRGNECIRKHCHFATHIDTHTCTHKQDLGLLHLKQRPVLKNCVDRDT